MVSGIKVRGRKTNNFSKRKDINKIQVYKTFLKELREEVFFQLKIRRITVKDSLVFKEVDKLSFEKSKTINSIIKFNSPEKRKRLISFLAKEILEKIKAEVA